MVVSDVVISEVVEVTLVEVSVTVSVVIDKIRLVLKLEMAHFEVLAIGVVVSVVESPVVEAGTSVIDVLIADLIVSTVVVFIVDVVMSVIEEPIVESIESVVKVYIVDVVVTVREVSVVDVVVSVFKVVMSVMEVFVVAVLIVDVVISVVNVSTADVVMSVVDVSIVDVAMSVVDVSIVDAVVSIVEISVVEVVVVTNEPEPLLESAGVEDDTEVDTVSEVDGSNGLSVEEDSTLVEVSIIVVILGRDKDVEEREVEVDEVASCDVKYTDDSVDEVNDGLEDINVKSVAMLVVE